MFGESIRSWGSQKSCLRHELLTTLLAGCFCHPLGKSVAFKPLLVMAAQHPEELLGKHKEFVGSSWKHTATWPFPSSNGSILNPT